MVNILEIEMNSFSKWFKWAFFVLFLAYLGAWLFTIYLSNIQEARKFEVILPTIPQDSEEYRNLAESIRNSFSFSQNGETDTLRAPGYPAFVVLFRYVSGSYFMVTLVQIFLTFASTFFIRRLGIFFHSQRAGEIAGLLFLLNPLILTLSLVILTDILFLFLFLLGFYLALFAKTTKKVFIPSILFALAIYVRPMGIFALPIFASPFVASMDSWKGKIKSVILMVLIILIAASPWVYRNYKATGVADFTSFKAINLAGFALPLFLSSQNSTSLAEERINVERVIGIPASQWGDLRYSKKVSKAATKIILEQPFSYLKYHLTASLPFLFSSSIQDALVTYKRAMHIDVKYEPGAIKYLVEHNWKMFFESISVVWWKIGERILWVLIYIIAAVGLWKNKRKPLSWAFLFIPFYLMLLAGPAANARYAIQSLPFILILFATGVISLKDKIIKRHVQE